ncbi:MAG TPA: hypothetical protein VMT46_05940 [Anaerolineaceae bacterium]|nr:hypothetical protein [Anaerolineaceae bacterium]
MAKQSPNQIDVYLEAGKKRTFAGAIDWPGWCRSGPTEEAALQALVEYGPRYARSLEGFVPGFQAPVETSHLNVVQRLDGNATTDFGAPDLPPALDSRPVSEEELRLFQKFLEASWRAFAVAVKLAEGKELRKGPRGGGRELEAIARHVLDSHEGYLGALGWKAKKWGAAGLGQQIDLALQEDREALAASACGEIPAVGPRGGARWSPRYFVRRAAWHILDHAWEIEDRIL